MQKARQNLLIVSAAIILFLVAGGLNPVSAHHVLGRPSYGLDEHSNTPPGEQVEITSGNYLATFMAFPAFPQPEEPARVNLYLSALDGGHSYDGQVAFSIKKNGWFAGEEEPLGAQLVDDKVYRQNFTVSASGDYIVVARFESGGEKYVLEFPLVIGDAASSSTVAIAAGAVLFALIVLTLMNRRRFTRAKISSVRDEIRDDFPGKAGRDETVGQRH